jgi:hypothetical protein
MEFKLSARLRRAGAAWLDNMRHKANMNSSIKALAIVAISLTLVGCQTGEYSHAQSDELAIAILEMQNQEIDRFIIVEVSGTENFFQFAGDDAKTFLIDVPEVSLSPSQLTRAKHYFSKYGIESISTAAKNSHV